MNTFAEKIIPLFRQTNEFLTYDGNVYITRRSVNQVLEAAPDSIGSGVFNFAKTLITLGVFHGKHKYKKFTNYCDCCIVCQKK